MASSSSVIKKTKNMNILLKVRISSRMLREIKKHHKYCLKELFIQYYEPLSNGNHDKLWVTHLPTSVKTQLRLHLSVLRDGDVFDWTDQQIGTKILRKINDLIF